MQVLAVAQPILLNFLRHRPQTLVRGADARLTEFVFVMLGYSCDVGEGLRRARFRP